MVITAIFRWLENDEHLSVKWGHCKPNLSLFVSTFFFGIKQENKDSSVANKEASNFRTDRQAQFCGIFSFPILAISSHSALSFHRLRFSIVATTSNGALIIAITILGTLFLRRVLQIDSIFTASKAFFEIDAEQMKRRS